MTASVGKKHDQHWMIANLPEDGSVQMDDLTYKMGCLVLGGPDSPKVLEKCAYGNVLRGLLQIFQPPGKGI